MGSHLFPIDILANFKNQPFIMIEDYGLCTHFSYHKQKLAFFLESMRNHRDLLRHHGFEVCYFELDIKQKNISFVQRLEKIITEKCATSLTTFAIEDRFFRQEIEDLCLRVSCSWIVIESPMFLNSDKALLDLMPDKRPLMKTFYEKQRKHRQILMENNKPQGEKFSFDKENRKKLPKNIGIPPLPQQLHSRYRKEIVRLIEDIFPHHPGSLDENWLPTTSKGAHLWLWDFIEHRLAQFGPYEDAISNQFSFLFHSALSPLLNNGLLIPGQVISEVIEYYNNHDVPLNSVEGFIRQIIGWREFIKGIDEKFGEQQHKSNFFNHQRKLSSSWYNGTLGIPPIDDAIKKALRYGYCHHIERLMLLSNLMLLSEIHPHQAYRWFMEMFVDSADWVMGPNVFGMGQFSDGGIFATKPYLCGSNYILKMSSYQKGDWCLTLDGLYWRFISKNRAFFLQNPRLSMAIRTLDAMKIERREALFGKAHTFIETHTYLESAS